MNVIGKMQPERYTPAEELIEHIGEDVYICGTVYKIREMTGFAFVLLQTRRQLVQCVFSPEHARFELSSIAEQMRVVFRGRVEREPRSRVGYEVTLIDVTIACAPEEKPPLVINQKELQDGLDVILDHRPLTLRNEKQRAIFKLQEGIGVGFRGFLLSNGFTEIHSPKIVRSGAEGGANIFSLDYFGREAYLAQSPQFYKQMMVGVFERVFEIGPVFRAEKHDTARHVNEYTSVDLEMGFIESFEEICRLEVSMIAHCLEHLQVHYAPELELLRVQLPVCDDIPSITFDDAKQWLAKAAGAPLDEDSDLSPDEEKRLCALIKKKTGSDFVFVTHYKSEKRPFYAMDTPGDPVVTESFDLLFRGMEVTTGGQRIHVYREQVEKMRARNMNVDDFSSYLMAHQYGLPPHGGLGLGLERFTARLLGLDNIRHATLFARDINRLEP